MPFVTAEDGVRIHYELEGPEDGIPLVLMHGTNASLESWRELGYAKALGSRFRLILIDSRGHGESDSPVAQDAYELRGRVMDILAVLGDVGIGRAHFVGYSMGGWIGWGCLIYAPQRFHSLTIGGFGPVPDPYFGKTVDELFGARWGAFDSARQRVLRAVFAETARFGGARQALRTGTTPILLYAGDLDPRFESVRQAAPLGKRASFLALPGKDHAAAIYDAGARDQVTARVTAFIDEVEATSK